MEGGEGAVVEAAAFVYVDFRKLDAGAILHAQGREHQVVIFFQYRRATGDNFFFSAAQEHRQGFRRQCDFS